MNKFFAEKRLAVLSFILVFTVLLSFNGCKNDKELLSHSEKRVAYTQLSKQEKILYERMRMAISDYDTAVTEGFEELEIDDVSKVYEYLLFDYPELFWAAETSTIYYEQDDDKMKVTEFVFEYSLSDAQRKLYQVEVESKIEPFLLRASTLSNDYEKVLAAYEYVIDLCTYDSETYDRVTLGDTENISSSSYNMLGVFIDNKAVCTGYVKAFQYLLNRMGIPVIYVNGESKGEKHVWNAVCIDGVWCYIDVTWGDLTDKEGNNLISYNYFGLTTEELLRSHTITSMLTLPECTDTTYNYYRYNNLFMESYNFDEVKSIISSAIENSEKTAQMKFSSLEALQTAAEELFNSQRIFDIYANYPETIVTDSARYVTDEDNYILKVIIDYK